MRSRAHFNLIIIVSYAIRFLSTNTKVETDENLVRSRPLWHATAQLHICGKLGECVCVCVCACSSCCADRYTATISIHLCRSTNIHPFALRSTPFKMLRYCYYRPFSVLHSQAYWLHTYTSYLQRPSADTRVRTVHTIIGRDCCIFFLFWVSKQSTCVRLHILCVDRLGHSLEYSHQSRCQCFWIDFISWMDAKKRKKCYVFVSSVSISSVLSTARSVFFFFVCK